MRGTSSSSSERLYAVTNPRLLALYHEGSWKRSASTSSPLPIFLETPLSGLCDLIASHKVLEKSAIMGTESYHEYSSGVRHRFLLIELHHVGHQDYYLRLDRRIGGQISPIQLLFAYGVAPANDVVRDEFSIHQLHSPNVDSTALKSLKTAIGSINSSLNIAVLTNFTDRSKQKYGRHRIRPMNAYIVDYSTISTELSPA